MLTESKLIVNHKASEEGGWEEKKSWLEREKADKELGALPKDLGARIPRINNFRFASVFLGEDGLSLVALPPLL